MIDTTELDKEYSLLVQDVLEHINAVKNTPQGKDSALIDIIYDYCFRNGVEPEYVGDAISSDVYFKSFIEKDCELHRIFKGEEPQPEEW